MKKPVKSIVALLLTFILTFQGLIYADFDVDKQVKTKRVIVKFKSDIVNLEAVDKDKEFKHVKKLNKKGIYIIETDEKGVKKLKKDKNVEYIEDDGVIKKSDDNITWNVDLVKAPELQKQNYNGQGIKVAVFDTGIDINNRDVQVKDGVSFVEGVSDFSDDNGHGTAVAGIIGAVKNNEGYLGVAPEVELYSVKVLDKDGLGTYSNIIQGIEWAIENDMDIISMSLGGTQYSKILKDAISEANKNNILVVAASGNEGRAGNIDYPARFNEVICVGAIDKAGQLATFSNKGYEMDLVAPGTDIETTYLNNSNIKLSGTSAAVPHVVGVAAQIWSAKNDLTQEQLKALLYKSATPLGDVKLYGWGMVNAIQSLENINEKIELPEQDGSWVDINEIDSGTDGLVKFSYKYTEYDNQHITPGSSVTVRAGFYDAHSRCIVTTYNANSPSVILDREERAPISGNAYMTYTCPAGVLNSPGTYKIRYHAKDDDDPSYNSDGRWDDVFTVYVDNTNPDPDPDPTDDYSNDFGGATTVSIGSSKSGRIDYDGDVDFFKFRPTTAGTYIIQSSGTTDVMADLYNGSYSWLDSGDDEAGFPNFKIEYTLQANQTYYLSVNGYSDNTGRYSFSITKMQITDDHGNNFAGATSIALNSSIPGNINYPGDFDYFKFTATIAGTYKIESSGDTDVFGKLYNNNQGFVDESDDDGVGTNFLINAPLLANTTYYVMVRHYDEAESGPYSLKVSTPTGKPDLEVTDISWSPANPVEGDEVTFSATIKNNGNAATQAGTSLSVRFTVGSGDVAWSRGNTASIPAGGTVTLTANGGPFSGNSKWTSVSGTHTIKAYVDDLNTFSESNESNNERSESITVAGLPDLVIDKIVTNPAGLVAGLEAVKLKATVINDGPGVSNGAFDVEFKVMGGSSYQTVLQTLYGSYSGTINAGYNPTDIETSTNWTPTSGSYRIVAKVNYKGSQGGIKEKNYNNNAFTMDIPVGGTDYNEPYDNNKNSATQIKWEYKSKIHDSSDVDWYYYDTDDLNEYLMVSLDTPGYLTQITSDDQNYDLELYDSSGKLLTVIRSNYSSSILEFLSYKIDKKGRYYIKVFSHDSGDSSDTEKYILRTTTKSSEVPYGGEFVGWAYLGPKRTLDASYVVNFKYGDGMDKTWATRSGKEVSYKDVMEGYDEVYTYSVLHKKGGLSIWNDANIAGAPDTIFEYDMYSRNTVKASKDSKNRYYASVIATNGLLDGRGKFDMTFNMLLMSETYLNRESNTYRTASDNGNFNMAKAIVAHEFGHVLGLKDLYINKSYGYTYNNSVVDNSNKLMFGYSGSTTHLNMSTYFNPKDIEGVRAIQGWAGITSFRNQQNDNAKSVVHASYVNYNNEDLYNKSAIIVKGKIKSIVDYNSSNLDELYSRVTLEESEYFKDINGLRSNELIFLQDGNSTAEFAENSLFKIGDQVTLFLEKTEGGELIISGGPQGRFDIIDTGTELVVQRHMDKYINQELLFLGYPPVEPKVIPILEFKQQVEEGIQNIAPIITGETLTLPNENNWYKDNVTVHFTAEDMMYGIASISPDVTVSTEGADKSVTGTATNTVGNESIYIVSGINIDKTTPSILARKSVEQNTYGWYSKPITIHFGYYSGIPI